MNHKFQWQCFIGTGLCRMGFWWSSLRQFQSHSASLLESFCESIYLLLFFWGLFVSCCLSCSSWLLFRASLFGDGVRILVLFLSSDPPVPGLREEKCWKGLLENFGFLLVSEIVQQIRHTRLKKAQRCASFPNLTDVDLTPASSAVLLPGSCSIHITHPSLIVQLGCVCMFHFHCSSDNQRFFLFYQAFSTCLKWFFLFLGRERCDNFNAIDPASIERCIEE